MSLLEKIFPKNQNENASQEEETLSVQDDLIHNTVLFSATGKRESRRAIYLTEYCIFVKVGERVISIPIESCSLQSAKHSDSFRVTIVSDGGHGKGLRLDKSDFRDFWKELSAVREDD